MSQEKTRRAAVVGGVFTILTLYVGLLQFHGNSDAVLLEKERDLVVATFDRYDEAVGSLKDAQSERALIRAASHVAQSRWALHVDRMLGHEHRLGEFFLDFDVGALWRFTPASKRPQHRRFLAYNEYWTAEAKRELASIVDEIRNGDREPIRTELAVVAATFLKDCDALQRLYTLGIGFDVSSDDCGRD